MGTTYACSHNWQAHTERPSEKINLLNTYIHGTQSTKRKRGMEARIRKDSQHLQARNVQSLTEINSYTTKIRPFQGSWAALQIIYHYKRDCWSTAVANFAEIP